MTIAPDTSYARSGEVQIAYQVHGEGDIDLVLVGGPASHLDVIWEDPGARRYLERIGDFARVVRFDRRGTGLSDPITGSPTLEQQADDLGAVMDAVGFERAALVGDGDGGRLCALFAATRPERVSALCLYGTSASGAEVVTPERQREAGKVIEDHWGEGGLMALYAPSVADDPAFTRWWKRFERASTTPHTARGLLAMLAESDLRPYLTSIRAPTLVLHRSGDTLVPVDAGRRLAEGIPGARFVELEGIDNLSFVGNVADLVDEVEEFLTGGRERREPERVLATVLFTDIVDSTRRAAELGGQRWRDLLAAHHELVRRELARHGGREVKTMGDGFLAQFELPGAAVRCARAIRAALAALDLEVRAGVHTGECELIGDDIGGLAVHIGARLSGLAKANEILVSGTVKDIVVGSAIELTDRGLHSLRGVPGEWRVFAA
ncbi:MAG: Adenylate cyclase [uncultured Solirubrobacterales bacterium]|uniref:Adenylate cyclase n=1 Tax=uncultured Solirubrobacterales bacterium TaxID=768556 RepID=A0A6J4RVG4_9ACTN|nr:MAG: Adenylate cyclase [uncultured Solirubrobacterales bacterium]